jgi:hypothetical protein
MVETAAHMVDDVLPPVQFRQWVMSVPKRVRWHLKHSSPQVGSRSDSIYEYLPLAFPKFGQPMRLIAFIMEPPKPVAKRCFDYPLLLRHLFRDS